MKNFQHLHFWNLLTIICFLITAQTFSQTNPNGWDTAWVSSFGGSDADYGRDIKETSDKGFIIVGTSSTFGSGNTSFYLIKTDSLGKHEWSKSIGSTENDVAYSVEIASDTGYYLSGSSNWNFNSGYDGYLIKTNKKGEVLWSKNYGGSDWDFFYNSCLMPDGGLLFCGETYSGSQGGSDYYIVRTNPNGDTLWTKTFGGKENDIFYSIEQKFNRIYVIGKTFNSTSGQYDACIYKLDLNGNILLQKTFAGTANESIIYNDLFLTNSGNILICGVISNTLTNKYIMQKLDTLNFAQVFYYTNNQDYYLRSIIEGYNNDVIAIGQAAGGLGGKSALYLRFDAGNNYLASPHFGGEKDENAYEIIKTTRGYAFIGSTNSYGNSGGSNADNVYLVVFNKKNLVNDYFLVLTEFKDNLSPVGLNTTYLDKQNSIIYPNPINQNYSISFSHNNYDQKTLLYLIYDSTGKLVSKESPLVYENTITLNRNNLMEGIYFYRLLIDSTLIGFGKISVE